MKYPVLRIGIRSTMLLLLLLVCVLSAPRALSHLFAAQRPDVQVALSRTLIHSIGAHPAHSVFSHLLSYQPPAKTHRLAHAFGAALFEVEGAQGMSVCDMQFQFGCFHEYFKHFIAAFGTAALPDAIAECERDLGLMHPCEHAVGHGLITHYGYDEESLKRSLALCNTLFNDDLINGCVGGVFMEFNLYTSVSINEEPRRVDERGVYAPCEHIDPLFQESCVWWLPQWWVVTGEFANQPRHVLFAEMGDYCRTLPASLQKHQRMCFNSIGQKAASGSGWRPALMEEFCEAAGVTAEERLFCTSYAAYMITYMDERDVSVAEALCSHLASPHHQTICTAYAHKEYYVLNEVPL